MDAKNKISERVKEIRLARKWSQEKLAEEANLTSRTISNVECGQGINLKTLIAISDALEYPLKDLLP